MASEPTASDWSLEKLAAVESRVEELEAAVREAEADRERHEAEIAELRQRTDLLESVDGVDEMTARERSVRLLQHLRQKAKRVYQEGNPGTVRIDREAAAEATHHPDVDRTAYYHDMRRAARFVGDDAVCWYDGGELHLDASASDAPWSDFTDPDGGADL